MTTFRLGLAIVLAALLLSACATAPTSDSSVDVGAQAVFASQTRDAAGNSANVLSVLAERTRLAATATRQATLDALNDAGTRTALDTLRLQPTQTREAMQTAEAHLQATESAQQVATARANFATYAAQTPTARAIAAATEQAHAQATQTEIAAQPERTRAALQARDEMLAALRAQDDAQVRANTSAMLAPISAGFWALVGPCSVAMMLLIFAFGMWRVVLSLTQYLDSKTLAASSSAMKELLILDRAGNPMGYLKPAGATVTFEPFAREVPELPEGEPEAKPPAVAQDAQDRQPPQLTAPQDPDMLYGIIHYSELKVFVAKILETGDWTQDTWADKELPRGYKLTKDTKIGGKRIAGGYSRLLALFTEPNLIIERRKGSAGRWNPNAPRTVEGVMDVLYHRAPKPPLPQAGDARQAPSPTDTVPQMSAA